MEPSERIAHYIIGARSLGKRASPFSQVHPSFNSIVLLSPASAKERIS
jgi:hypothetical protein